MSRLIKLSIFCVVVLFFTGACSKPATNSASQSVPNASPAPSEQRITSESVVQVKTNPLELTAGGSGEAIVSITIQHGYHINANPPTYPYLKATQLEIVPADGVSGGSIAYPKALTRKFPFAEKELAVYEGTNDVKATLKADKSASPGQRSISAKLRIQACDDQVCYPPGTLALAIPVNIK